MNRKLIVTLLRKDIQELDMLTEGFMEMNEYPKAIIHLAERKSEDIQSYIRQLSDQNPETSAESEATESQLIIHTPEPVTEVPQFIEPETQTTVEEVVTVTSTVEVQQVEPVENNDKADDEKLLKEVEVTEILSTTETTTTEDNKKTVREEKISTHTQTRHELLSKPDNTLGSTLANKKISDIRQALNISDRFRYQRELFRGNGEDMNKTLAYLNQLATYAEAESFLQSKYAWDKENETVEDFYQLLRRKFL